MQEVKLYSEIHELTNFILKREVLQWKEFMLSIESDQQIQFTSPGSLQQATWTDLSKNQ
jgi:hypothetical protein